MATATTKALNKANLEAAGRTSSKLYSNPDVTGVSGGSSSSGGGSNFVTTTGKLIDSTGKVIGNAPAGTTGTFTEGVAPTSAQGSAMSTAKATSYTNPADVPTGTPVSQLPEAQVTTKQPSPTTAQATPFTQPDVQSLVDAYNQKGGPLTLGEIGKPQDLAQQYRQGLQTAKTSGQVPTTQGAASTAIQSSLPSQGYDSSITDQYLQDEPVFSKIMDSFAEMMDPKAQTDSLVSQYDALRKASGLDAINTELIDTKRIIDGTEDDIRSEVMASNGFATDSQVLALASARNKTLIKNYNALLATRDSLNEQINTTINLAQQDRQYAQQKMNQQLDLGFKMLEYRDKFQNNAKENYNNIIGAVGYQGLLDSTNGNPYQVSLIEKTLGLGQGGLRQLASIKPKLSELDQAKLDQIRAETAKTRAETGKVTATTVGATSSPQATQSVSLVNDLLNDPNLNKVTGVSAYNPLNLIPGSPVAKTRNQLAELKAQLSLNNRSQLKGTGSISDFESKMLESASSAINRNLNVKDLQDELSKVRGLVTVMNGGSITVTLTDPKSGASKAINLTESGLEKAVNDGLLIKYQ